MFEPNISLMSNIFKMTDKNISLMSNIFKMTDKVS